MAQISSLYLDDILIFSETFEAHLEHLSCILQRLISAGLKLKPSKFHFICQEVEYLGHILSPTGLRPNLSRLSAVSDYPRPKSVKEVCQFLGLTSYYRRFIKGFARIAHPLHGLTQLGVAFSWTSECEQAFQMLKKKLVESPILHYPNFDTDFTLETDASIDGFGAVLSQVGTDGLLHPVAYASRALSPQEKRYGITELETLAVVWAVSHFHAYLYGHNVHVLTDHSAVRAVLETPTLTGKHARWWSKVFGSGIKNITIKYRPGKENSNADTLSRCPHGRAPSTPMVTDAHIAEVHSVDTDDMSQLLQCPPVSSPLHDISTEQDQDPDIFSIKQYLLNGTLPQTLSKHGGWQHRNPSSQSLIIFCTSLILNVMTADVVLCLFTCVWASWSYVWSFLCR